jgi:hypothetical protein
MNPNPEEFAVALGTLEQELDWGLLGQLQCHEGGENFFSPDQIAANREAGLLIAGALGEHLMTREDGPHRSLYVGPAVGELVPILMEHFVLGREVTLVNQENAETAELNRGFEAVEAHGIRMPRIQTCELESIEGEFDHGWLVSVLNDPDAFPALHDELYGRTGELATGKGSLPEELSAATSLATSLLGKLAKNSLLSTTDEELPVLRPVFSAGHWLVKPAAEALLTAVVGDPLRFLRLSRPGGR